MRHTTVCTVRRLAGPGVWFLFAVAQFILGVVALITPSPMQDIASGGVPALGYQVVFRHQNQRVCICAVALAVACAVYALYRLRLTTDAQLRYANVATGIDLAGILLQFPTLVMAYTGGGAGLDRMLGVAFLVAALPFVALAARSAERRDAIDMRGCGDKVH